MRWLRRIASKISFYFSFSFFLFSSFRTFGIRFDTSLCQFSNHSQNNFPKRFFSDISKLSSIFSYFCFKNFWLVWFFVEYFKIAIFLESQLIFQSSIKMSHFSLFSPKLLLFQIMFSRVLFLVILIASPAVSRRSGGVFSSRGSSGARQSSGRFRNKNKTGFFLINLKFLKLRISVKLTFFSKI